VKKRETELREKKIFGERTGLLKQVKGLRKRMPRSLCLLLLPILVLGSAQDECKRFCPEDLKAAVFRPMVKERLEWVEETMEEAIKGLETLTQKMSAIPANLKSEMGMGEEADVAKEPGELRTLVKELVVHAARADQRAWGRIIDTEADVLDPSRAPKAPRTLSDLRAEVEGLAAAWRETEESFHALQRSLGSSLGKMLGPMLSVMEGMVKAAGAGGEGMEKLGLEKLRSQVDNLMGRVLLRMVVSKGKEEEERDLRIFGDLTDLADRLAKDFVVKGRKLTLEEFWNEELSLLPRGKMEDKEEKKEQDVLEMEEVMLVTHMVESNMPPSIKIPLPPPPHPSSLRRR